MVDPIILVAVFVVSALWTYEMFLRRHLKK